MSAVSVPPMTIWPKPSCRCDSESLLSCMPPPVLPASPSTTVPVGSEGLKVSVAPALRTSAAMLTWSERMVMSCPPASTSLTNFCSPCSAATSVWPPREPAAAASECTTMEPVANTTTSCRLVLETVSDCASTTMACGLKVKSS